MEILANYIENIKTGFVPDDGTKGFGSFISRIKNLWKHSLQGKITIVIVSFSLMGMVTPDSGGGSNTGASSSSYSKSTCPCDGAKFSNSNYYPYCSEYCAAVCEHYDSYTGSYK